VTVEAVNGDDRRRQATGDESVGTQCAGPVTSTRTQSTNPAQSFVASSAYPLTAEPDAGEPGVGDLTATTRSGAASRLRNPLVPSALLVVAILLVAANLRPAVTGLGPILDEVRAGSGMPTGLVSVLTALPTVCFGAAGFLAPALTRRFGVARAIGLAIALLTIGVGVRVVSGSSVLLIGTLLAGAGIAVCNVLLPVVVKESYGHRIGLITGLYTAVLQGVAALASAVATPLYTGLGGWRGALGFWTLPALLGFLLWLLVARHHKTGPAPTTPDPALPAPVNTAMFRRPLAWLVTVFFGLQAMSAYALMGWLPQVLMAAGISRGTAGLMMGLVSVLGVPISLIIVPIAARARAQSAWTAGLCLIGAIGVLGILLAPAAAPWLWAFCIGMGMGVFALAVALISLRSRSADDTKALSTMAQSVGYLIAALGPLCFGMLHAATGGWTASLIVLLIGVCAQVVIGYLVGRPRYV
jgi:MFS transporter, CP family, cyanate transporter